MECTIYLTDDCNMKCNYCYEGNEKNKSVLSEDKLTYCATSNRLCENL